MRPAVAKDVERLLDAYEAVAAESGRLGLTGTGRLWLGMHVAAEWRGKGAGTKPMEEPA